MAKTVSEVMNPELFAVTPDETVAGALSGILAFGITGAPVVRKGEPVGMVTLRDLAEKPLETRVEDVMSTPAVTIDVGRPVDEAAALLAKANLHRLVVVKDRRVVGVVSALDLLRAVQGLPTPHPESFPGLDLDPSVAFSPPALLDEPSAMKAPPVPGVFALFYGDHHTPETLVWAEAAPNLQTRLLELLAIPQDEPELARHLDKGRGHLRFRAGAARHEGLRLHVEARLRGHMAGLPAPLH